MIAAARSLFAWCVDKLAMENAIYQTSVIDDFCLTNAVSFYYYPQ